MRHRFLLAAACLLSLSACAPAGSSPGGTGAGDPDFITTEEIRAQGPEIGDAYRLVQRLRPGWLRSRVAGIGGGGAREFARVILDGRPYGDLDSLRDFGLPELVSLQFMSATDATTRFGTGYFGGAILVDTQR